MAGTHEVAEDHADSKRRLASTGSRRWPFAGLGLRRIRHTVEVVDTPSTRGLILKVRHLVQVDE